MQDNLNEKFIAKLEEKYGPWTKVTSKFGTTSFGVIAADLSISASQFSKLIYGSATEGMYTRSIANIDRLLQHEQTRLALEKSIEQNKHLESKLAYSNSLSKAGSKRLIYVFMAFALGLISMYLIFQTKGSNPESAKVGQHPLNDFFEQGFGEAFDPPYLKESEVQDNCPCSAYEGEWSLEVPFKLPLPGSRKPGLYYIAKQSDMRMRCSNINGAHLSKGRAMLGYEYLLSEIWVDTEQEPLIPKFFDLDIKNYTAAFNALDFEREDRFQRVAVLEAFNVNNFEIFPDSINRQAELTGRYISELDVELAKTFEIDMNHIVQNVLGNLTKTNCQSTLNPFCDPNDLVEGESILQFDCMYTIAAENLGLGGGYPYTKKFRLEKQHYSDHLNCTCNSD